jgi:hypothetical protein
MLLRPMLFLEHNGKRNLTLRVIWMKRLTSRQVKSAATQETLRRERAGSDTLC